MAVDLKIDITQDLDTGETIRIDEITGNYTSSNTGGYGYPNILESAVTRTRFLFSSYQSRQQATASVTECVPNVQYEVTGSGSGAVVVDTKHFSLGQTFILEVDATPTIPSGLFVSETGVYAVLSSFLPSGNHVEFIPSDIGIDSLTYPNSASQVTYEVYTTKYLTGVSFPVGSYIVTGTPLNSVTLTSTGYTYNVGETFTVTGADTFTDLVGTNSVTFLAATVTEDFPLYYNAWQVYKTIEQSYVNDACCNKPCLEQNLFKVNSILESIEINYADDLNLDDSGTQALLDEITDIGNQQCQ